MARRIVAHDWTTSSLGPRQAWSRSLRTLVAAVVESKLPTCLAWGRDLTCIYNDAYRPILAATPEALGRPFREVWSETPAAINPPFDRILAGEAKLFHAAPFTINRFGRREEMFFDYSITPVRDDNEQVAGLMCQAFEITHHVPTLRGLNSVLQRQIVMQREHERLWALSTDIMIVAGFDGVITTVNPAWMVVLGWAEQEWVGRPFYDLVHPDDLDQTLEAVKSVAQGHVVRRFDTRCQHNRGHFLWIAWSAVASEDGLHAVGRDVTADKEQAEALALSEAALHQAQKMETLGQLTGGLAHDFNNLLTGISGSLEVMQKRLSQGRTQDLERYIGVAQEAAKRAAVLTHRLLAFSRRQTLDAKPTDINRLVAGIEDLVRRTVGPAITVEAIMADGLWSTLVDPHQLETALLNLCINARDAMPDGGQLTIETSNRLLDTCSGRMRDLPPGPYITLCVSDNGTGMSPEVVTRAFEPFFTTKPIGMGTGLGLSMVYGFVQQSGGQARIYSTVGQGTMVCLYLPHHLGAAATPMLVDESDSLPPAHFRETVLVVDDEPSVRLLVTEVLKDQGYNVIEAADGPAALKVLQADDRIDLLVTDVGLPKGMNGRQVADAARVHRAALKVLFITGYAENAVLSHGQLAPGMHVLTKPFALDVLVSVVKELIDGG